MFQLRCTVRNCSHPLIPNDRGLTCEAGHHFDRAKGGHWNLTQPQDKKSASPGDSDDAVLARHRWLERGYAGGLIDSLRPWVSLAIESKSPAIEVPRILDLGCGEGTFGPALFGEFPTGYCGIDLSRRAIRLAVQRWPAATWVLANADRGLPAAEQSVDCVISLFGRRPATEIARVLKPGGHFIAAVPGEEDLIELRERVQTAATRRNRCDAIIDQMQQHGLTCHEQALWTHYIEIGPEAITDALAMTYRAVRQSEKRRLEGIQTTRVTLAAELMRFTKA